MARGIVRSDVETLVEPQVVQEIFDSVTKDSKFMQLARRLNNMTSDTTKIKVVDELPLVYFVNEEKNNGRKNLTRMAWDNVFLYAEELAVIVPIKENLLNDVNINVWGEIKPKLIQAIGNKIDGAVLFGVDAPKSWGKGLIPTIIEKGKEVTETGKLYSDINDVMTKVEESGYNVTGLVGGVNLKGKFRMMTDTTGQPLANTEIGSLPRIFVDNGAWDTNKSLLVAGDFSQAVYAIRQDVTYKILDQAVIQDPGTGEILYNLAQDDMVALRLTFRMGYAIPNPVNILDQSESRYPFASLKKNDAVVITTSATAENEDTSLGKNGSELQEGVEIGADGKVTGKSKYVKGFTGFSSNPEEQNGNYLALKINEATQSKKVRVKLNTETDLTDDGIIVFRLDEQTIHQPVIVYIDGKEAYRLDLSGLELEAGSGAEAIALKRNVKVNTVSKEN